MSIQVQGEGYQLPLQPGEQAVFGTAADTQVRYAQGFAVRERHAVLHWRDDRWVLVDLDGYPGIYRGGEWVTEVEVTQPETVRLGGSSGPIVALTPLHRRGPRRRMWWLLAAAGIVLPAAVFLGVIVAKERAIDHRSYVIGTCVATGTHWSAGRAPVRPPGQPVDCEDRFDYKVLGVIPVPTPELTVANSDNLLRKRAIELSYGRCPPSTRPALGLPDRLGITHEVYCVQDSIFTIDNEAMKTSEQCVLRDGGEPRLATPCDQRHDYIVEDIDSLAKGPFPGDQEMAEVGENRCGDPPGLDPFHANERTWNQGYQWLLCLAQDNLEYEPTIAWAVDDLRAFWDEQLPDVSPKPSAVMVLEERDYDPKSPPTCGEDRLENNAWYCPGDEDDDFVAWDPRWLKSAFYDKYGDIAVAVVLAHEWGHVIQGRLGLFNEERWENLSAEDQKADPVKKEYQADCYAGAWLRHYYEGGDEAVVPAAGTDRNKAVHAIVDIADTYSSAAEGFEESAHGDALKRTENLLEGYREGWRSCQAILPA